jgi:hypothetical protein
MRSGHPTVKASATFEPQSWPATQNRSIDRAFMSPMASSARVGRMMHRHGTASHRPSMTQASGRSLRCIEASVARGSFPRMPTLPVRRAFRCPVRPNKQTPTGRPQPDSCGAAKRSYSITSSARSKMEVGISIPSVFAVFRLTTDLNLAACSIGISPGFVPLRILSTK